MSRFSDIHTCCIRGGNPLDPVYGALVPPIYQSTTFREADIGQEQSFSYTRMANPTVVALENNLGALENSLPACCFSSGMAAITSVCFSLLKAGDHVVCSDVVYGGTFRLLQEILAEFGVEISFIDTTKSVNLSENIKPNTRLVFLETPANPTLQITDLAACCAIARQHGALTVVDNTFLTAALQRPLELGADLSLYSTTKYIDGHNAAVGGAVCTNNEELLERLHYVRKCLGTIQTPQAAWLTIQGLKTLAIRLDRHAENALLVARALQKQSGVKEVFYPFLATSPQLELAKEQQKSGGGIVSIVVDGGLKAASIILKSLRLCTPTRNLGVVETIVTHPASMTHADVPVERRLELGICDGLIRISVGLENPTEIFADLQQAILSANKDGHHV